MWKDDIRAGKMSAEFKNKALRIYVTNAHMDHKPDWIMHCRELGIDTQRIPAVTSDDGLDYAKLQAVRLVKHKLYQMIASLPD